MRTRIFAAIASVSTAAVLSGCGGGPSAPATVPVLTPQATTSQSPTPAAKPSVKPLSFYAAQYLRLVKPYNKAIAVFATKIGRTNSTYAEVQPSATRLAKAGEREDIALVRAQWPSSVRPDIHALVRADAAVNGDLTSLVTVGTTQLLHDLDLTSTDANIVRADLGLKAVKS